MKIFIAASWLKLGGGVTRTLFELLKRIDYNKHDVTLMLMSLDKDVLKFVPEQVRVIETKDNFQTESSQTYIKKLLKKGRFLTAASCATDLIDFHRNGDNYRHQGWITSHMEKQDEEYDIAISYAMMNSIVNKYVIDNVRAKKKILWCHIEMGIYDPKYIKGLEKLYAQYDQINCVSLSALNSIKKMYPDLKTELRVTYNFIDKENITELAEGPVDIDIPTDKLKLCTVSRISEQKGTDILVDAAKTLYEQGTDFVWWVVGTRYDDAFNKQVESKISEYGLENRVLLLGEKNPPYPFIRSCDIYVQPSRYEGYCTTTNEAKVLYKPVITTLVSGAEEQFENGINGTVTEVSADAVAKAIKELADDDSKRNMYIQSLKTGAEIAQETSFESMII